MINYDTWEDTDAALRAVRQLFIYLHDNKPKKDTPGEKLWEAELVEVRKWAITIHERRIQLLLRK